MSNGFRADGQVNLSDVEIGGNLNCAGGFFRGARGPHGEMALWADRARVRGSVFLANGFRAEAQVRLDGAQIGGNLQCDSGNFSGAVEETPRGARARGTALQMGGATVEGGVFLRNGFHADGEVCLLGAQIGGSLDCAGGTFRGSIDVLPGDERREVTALDAGGTKIGDSVYLRDGFRAEGEVRLLGAEVGHDLVLAHATLPRGLVNAQRASVKGILLCQGLRSKEAHINLMGASAGELADDHEGWPGPGKLHLDGFAYARIVMQSETDAKTRLRWLRLQLRPEERGRNSWFRPQPYQQLARVLREQGEDEQARKILIGLEDDRCTYGGLTRPDRAWAWILKWTIAYGYRPLRALWFIGAFVALGFIIFGSAYRAGQLIPSDRQAYEDLKGQKATPPYYEGFCALVYSLDVFVPIIDLGQRSKWKPTSTGDVPVRPSTCGRTESLGCVVCQAAIFSDAPSFPPWFVRLFRWVDILAGWFFTSLFVAGISGLVRSN